MAKRLTLKQKEEIKLSFSNGKTIDELAKQYSCTKLTISRNLKKDIGEDTYKEIISKKNFQDDSFINKKDPNDELEKVNFNEIKTKDLIKKNYYDEKFQDDTYSQISPFVEITPLNDEIDHTLQKDLSSIPISDLILPEIVYMVVNKQTELEIKLLKEYPEWQFLSEKDLKRKTIEIFMDIKIAKRKCGKENKVIKVPNTKVFKIVAPLLSSRGISRIVSTDKLISL